VQVNRVLGRSAPAATATVGETGHSGGDAAA
jgi:hypothetical protein